MTTTEIDTEITTETEIKNKEVIATSVDMQQLNEIAIAKSKQSKYQNSPRFEQLKEEYAEIEQNNTEHTSIQQIQENQTQHSIAYLPKNHNKNNNNLKNNARLKNFIVCATIAMTLCASLLIYNAVQITVVKMQIASIETQISTGATNYENALKQLKKLTETQELQEQAVDLNMGEAQETITAELIQTRDAVLQQQNNNWFNKLCNFLSNLF